MGRLGERQHALEAGQQHPKLLAPFPTGNRHRLEPRGDLFFRIHRPQCIQRSHADQWNLEIVAEILKNVQKVALFRVVSGPRVSRCS